MNKIKQYLSNLKNATPRRVQWLLLAVAFVVVIIMLTLVLGRKKTNAPAPDMDADIVPVVVTVMPEQTDWSTTDAGDVKTQMLRVTATGAAKVTAVRTQPQDAKYFKMNQTCTAIAQIDADVACNINITFAPTAAMDTTPVSVFVDWHAMDEHAETKHTERALIVLGAVASAMPEPVAVVEPVTVPEPVVVPDAPAFEYEPDYDFFAEEDFDPMANMPVATEIRHEIEALAPSTPFLDARDVAPREPEYVRAPEGCTDFAIPGYNLSGVQIGWIKPSGGAYYFHPFADQECKKATGVYNPDNGIITDIKNTGKKIGTDAEHIGYVTITNGAIPQLSNAPQRRQKRTAVSYNDMDADALPISGGMATLNGPVGNFINLTPAPEPNVRFETTDGHVVQSTQPYDRRFVLRQYKPIPATIVSDVRADPKIMDQDHYIPVRATVDRNVYADNGRTIIVPTGTLMLGYITGTLPGPYTSIGRMQINWYQFVLPNGVEFNFDEGFDPFSADAQGRVGVPGYGSTDYMEQFIMPMLTAIVPAAVNMIAPVADKFVNQIDLDNNTVVQSGTVRSSELAKNEIITAWNSVAQKLMVDMMDNTVPPFTIAAGTRITVYSPVDLQVVCNGSDDKNKKCNIKEYNPNTTRRVARSDARPNYNDGSWVGQSRSFNLSQFCRPRASDGVLEVNDSKMEEIVASGYSYSTVRAFCQSQNYQAINNARQEAVYQNQMATGFANQYNAAPATGVGSSMAQQGNQAYNENVLGLKYDENGVIENPFNAPAAEDTLDIAPTIGCMDGSAPDEYGCCTGEEYTVIEGQPACCPVGVDGDCFDPITF